jgi:ankyrin repeat protein
MNHIVYSAMFFSLLSGSSCFGTRAHEELFEYINQIKRGNITINVEAANKHIDLLIEHGARVNVHDKNNMTPLMIAAQSDVKHIEAIIERLIVRGADVNARNHHRQTAFHFALKERNTRTIKKLVQHGAGVRAVNLFFVSDSEELIELLLPYCANLQERDETGDSLLHRVVGYSYKSTKLLIDHNVDPHIRNSYNGDSILHAVFARQADYVDADDEHEITKIKLIIKYLLDKGLSLNLENNRGEIPLHTLITSSISQNVKKHVIDYMISLGADPFKKDHNGLSVIHYAMHGNQTAIVNAFYSAVFMHQPMNIDHFQAQLLDDMDEIKKSIAERNRLQTSISSLISYMYTIGLNAFALYGTIKTIMVLRKVKVN